MDEIYIHAFFPCMSKLGPIGILTDELLWFYNRTRLFFLKQENFSVIFLAKFSNFCNSPLIEATVPIPGCQGCVSTLYHQIYYDHWQIPLKILTTHTHTNLPHAHKDNNYFLTFALNIYYVKRSLHQHRATAVHIQQRLHTQATMIGSTIFFLVKLPIAKTLKGGIFIVISAARN